MMTRSRPERTISRTLTAFGPISWALATLFATALGACAPTPADPTGVPPGTGGKSPGSGGSGTGGSQGSGGSSGSGGIVGTGGTPGTGGAGTGGSGTGGSGTGGRGGATTGTGGQAGGAAGRPGTGGVSAGGATGSAGAGGPSLCVPGQYIICEGFEETAVGTNVAPTGWTRTGAVDVVADAANVYRGLHSMRINAASAGPRRINKMGADIAALGGGHWGRIFYKVQLPAPHPAAGVVHSTLVMGIAMSPVAGVPGTGSSEYRVVDTVEDQTGHHQFLYNVQRNGAAVEFGNNRVPYNWTYDGSWHCAEWHIDYATQNYHLYLDGAEVTQAAVNNGAGNFTNSEIPMVFASMAVGWNNYQTSTPGFVAWIDEIAMHTSRIGCGN